MNQSMLQASVWVRDLHQSSGTLADLEWYPGLLLFCGAQGCLYSCLWNRGCSWQTTTAMILKRKPYTYGG